MPISSTDDELDANTPLLPSPTRSLKRPTPLPKLQISILLLLQLSEPITSQCIYPFINQLISELDITGGDKRKVGYYAGVIESLFFVTEALTVLQWSRISDHIGRKPVVLTGLVGICISMLSFGLSRTFWGLVISRCLQGILNGNIGVMKSMMGEITDSTNMAQGFALMPAIWSVGATIGPFMGGTLSRPFDRFPNIFRATFWKEYPYFLPCAASASFAAITFFITLFFLKETVQQRKETTKPAFSDPEGDLIPQFQSVVETQENGTARLSSSQSEEPVPLRDLLVFRVLISISNYAMLAFLNIAMSALHPLFYSTPIEYGGLGLPPSTIGLCLGGSGFVTGVFQAFFFAKIVRRWGPKRIFLVGMTSFLPIFALYPVINILAQRRGLSPLVWAILVLQLTMVVIMDMSYGCIFMFITTAAPNKRSLGATNGLAQTTVAVARAVGPALSTSLFAFSVEHNLIGGYAVYGVFILMSCLALFIGACLPEKAVRDGEE